MTVATATVETLTAEVRVMMVGSRQITASVAKQLDWCEYTQMEPMGRVKLGFERLTAIGKCISDGTLRLAYVPRKINGWLNIPDTWSIGDLQPVEVCVRETGWPDWLKRDRGDWYIKDPGALRLYIPKALVRVRCTWEDPHEPLLNGSRLPCGDPIVPRATRDQLWKWSYQLHLERAGHNEWVVEAENQPLIVLAGLR